MGRKLFSTSRLEKKLTALIIFMFFFSVSVSAKTDLDAISKLLSNKSYCDFVIALGDNYIKQIRTIPDDVRRKHTKFFESATEYCVLAAVIKEYDGKRPAWPENIDDYLTSDE